MNAPVYKLLFANYRWWFPTVVSGADIANHEFARRLVRAGVDVRVFGVLPPAGDSTIRRRRYVTEGVRVTLVHTDYLKTLKMELESFRPDVVITSAPEVSVGRDDIRRMMAAFDQFGVPTILYVHELHPVLESFAPVKNQFAAVVTNSKFMARKIHETWNVEARVIYPIPSSARFAVNPAPGPFITFFNPSAHKGKHIVDQLVSGPLRDRAFLFVEGFMEPGNHGISLVRTGNVVHARRSPDVASVYTMTRTLIVPSQWEEPFGRVALEAMYNRVPVVASNTGGLAESVGDGGILIDDYANPDAWVDAIRRLDDPQIRKQVVQAGTRHIKKFSLSEQVNQFLDLFASIIRTGTSS